MTRKRTRFDAVHLEDDQWHRPRLKKHREQCCACGLVHDVDYRIVEAPGSVTTLEFRARVNKRATAAARRAFRFEKD